MGQEEQELDEDGRAGMSRRCAGASGLATGVGAYGVTAGSTGGRAFGGLRVAGGRAAGGWTERMPTKFHVRNVTEYGEGVCTGGYDGATEREGRRLR